MANVKIKSTDEKVFEKEGVILRGTLDAKEAVDSGNYEYAGKREAAVANGKPVKEVIGKDKEPATDPKADIKQVRQMTTDLLQEFVEKRGFKIDGFDKLNLKEKRAAVIAQLDALAGKEDSDDEDGDEE